MLLRKRLAGCQVSWPPERSEFQAIRQPAKVSAASRRPSVTTVTFPIEGWTWTQLLSPPRSALIIPASSASLLVEPILKEEAGELCWAPVGLWLHKLLLMSERKTLKGCEFKQPR
ncbi:hypothetical protein AAFF_G00415610 [Aldrovandia affinis]|uniref:Uncharacterized protein n=1 Tax=Aldrovandia affinis TaxID=143900 RepID=A0AAD7SAS0_9TELE|nr:hypothetical protein AAFF_G00415610 [Aldrovandia affinis]